MKKVYESQNLALVTIARGIVEEAGIRCTLRNEFAAGAAGQLAPIDTWPQLWVLDDLHAGRAAAALRRAFEHTGADWNCPRCGEDNAASFDICWKCGV